MPVFASKIRNKALPLPFLGVADGWLVCFGEGAGSKGGRALAARVSELSGPLA